MFTFSFLFIFHFEILIILKIVLSKELKAFIIAVLLIPV